jgi:hypothetical protein
MTATLALEAAETIGRIDRRSPHPTDQLSRRFDDVCTTAADPLEIAAQLEANGLSDATARRAYGCTNIFALAEELFQRVPLRDDRTGAEPPERIDRAEQLRRGAVHAAPALACVVLLTNTSIPQVVSRTMLAVAAICWGLSQVVACLGYALVGRLDVDGARKLLRRVLLGGGLVSVIAACAAAGIARDVSVLPTAVAMALYVLASTTLVVLGAERRVIWVLTVAVPVVVGGGFLAPGTMAPFVVVTAAGGAVVAVYVLALHATRTAAAVGSPVITATEVWTSLGLAAVGWSWAILTLAGIGTSAAPRGAPAPQSVGVVPLLLCLGVAEWQLVRFRHQARAALCNIRKVSVFRRASWRAFQSAAGRYTATIVLTATVVAALTWPIYHAGVVLALVSFGLLGVALFAGLVLLSFSEWVPVLGCSVTAIVLYGLLRGDGPAPMLSFGSDVAALLARGFLVVSLFVVARTVTGRTRSHQ